MWEYCKYVNVRMTIPIRYFSKCSAGFLSLKAAISHGHILYVYAAKYTKKIQDF